MRILVIDDGDDIMRFCRQFLSGRHDLFHASNGRQAIEKIKKGGIDLLLLDKWFRGISESDLIGDKEDVRNEGLCILEKIKEIAPKIPVVMITAYGDEETHRRAIELGAIEYLTWEDLVTNPSYLEKRIKKAKRLKKRGDDG